MGSQTKLDFTSLLDELLAASDAAGAVEGGAGPYPSLRVDMLAQIERLQARDGTVSHERAMREYGETVADAAAQKRVTEPAPHLQPALDDLFFLDPLTISRELGIRPGSAIGERDRARRAFAMRYHPDRVPEMFRERAALRMQIANMLIDEAKRARR